MILQGLGSERALFGCSRQRMDHARCIGRIPPEAGCARKQRRDEFDVGSSSLGRQRLGFVEHFMPHCHRGNASCAATSPAATVCAGEYTCNDSDTPNTSERNCDQGVPDGDGGTQYCCVPLTATSCSPSNTTTFCPPRVFGFSCAGTDTPNQASLACSSVGPWDGGTFFCCLPTTADGG